MSRATISAGDQLANALHALGINFIMGGKGKDKSSYKHPTRLIMALTQSDEARLRLALIPLFLEHPEFAPHAQTVAKKLKPPARLTLQCYYSAAVWLQKKRKPNSALLPDYFSADLNLSPVADPEKNLRALAERHKELSGSRVNWLATYRHAEQVWQKGLEYRKA